MLTKKGLRKEFSDDWKKHYELDIFREEGFIRKKCPKCGKNFWTTDTEREICSDSSCEEYGFIGSPITKKKMDYIETWKIFEEFFNEKGHETVERYPVVDRWRPDLYFTIASIQDFQRIDNGQMAMEYPADPLIVPQVCLRFNDIPNVGVTGRHHTSFIMGGQHSFGKYWKDECIDHNFNFLHKVMGIPKDKLIYTEDVWSMPDFSQFGPCMETFSMGLELVNSVFSQFTKSGDSYTELPQKVIDVGWGHERLVWFSNGTFNGYEAVFGPVIKWLKKETGLEADDLFERYSRYAGGLDFDEVNNLSAQRDEIAKKLGVSTDYIKKVVGPMQALYAIADHTKTLLFASADGGIPSNVGGGYNLRVLMRRSFGFMEEYGFDFDIEKIAEKHAKFLKPLFPELSGSVEMFSKIYGIEKKRYENMVARSKKIISKEIKSGRVTEELMEKLYISHGITPELVQKAVKGSDSEIDIPDDFYSKITEKHMSHEKNEEQKEFFETREIENTKLLFYEDPYMKSFTSEVVKVVKNNEGNWVVLKDTLFYPEGGGQPYDIGELNGKDVKRVLKVGGIVFHLIKGEFKEGDKVEGKINWERRYELMKMHTGTHIISGSARKIFGNHVWQAGAQKGLDSSRIDLTHYLPFTKDDLENIERTANRAIEKEIRVKSEFFPRDKAEQKYGFVLYQGGASPGKKVRVINIENTDGIFDVEACGGTHLTNTREAQMVKIKKSERVQDGVNRIEFVSGKAALEYISNEKKIYKKIITDSEDILNDLINIKSTKHDHYKISREIIEASEIFSVNRDIIEMTTKKFMKEIKDYLLKIEDIQKKTGKKYSFSIKNEMKKIGYDKINDMKTLSDALFSLWKHLRKILDDKRKSSIDIIADDYLGKRNKNGNIIGRIDADRKYMIILAEKITDKSPSSVVILSNDDGDIVAMSKESEVKKLFDDIIEKLGGSGGGKDKFFQGKIKEPDKMDDL